MEKYVFLRFCAAIKERNLLKDTRNMSFEEQLAIFLMTIGHNERNRMIQEQFQHSGETISRHFNRDGNGYILHGANKAAAIK